MVIELRRHEDLDQLIERSSRDPILIFKHSTQCSISSAAYEAFSHFVESESSLTCGVVLVIEDRDISNRIETDLEVPHESPQAIVVRGGRAVWSASHWAITSESLKKAVS